MGFGAMYTNTTSNSNTAVGYSALTANTTGGSNVAVGTDALVKNTTGGLNTAVGKCAGCNITTGAGNLVFGKLAGADSVFDITTQSDRAVFGHNSVTNAYVKVAFTVTSDLRDKTNFGEVPHGLDFVNKLKPVSFQFKKSRDNDTPHGDVRYGFKAQDILALEGDNNVIIDTEEPNHLKYKGEHLVPVLVNAIKELKAEIELLKNK